MKKTAQEPKVTENPLYHDTWMLLRKYRDVVWSLELSVQQVRRQFQIEYGSSIRRRVGDPYGRKEGFLQIYRPIQCR